MPRKKPPTQKFVEFLKGMDENFAFSAATQIFECCRDYRKDFGCLDSEIVGIVADKLGIDEKMAIFCSHFPTLFYSLQKYRRNGRNSKIRLDLSETDRIGFDAYLTLNQLSRLGGHASASRLQRTMSGCHLVNAEDLQKALDTLQKIGLIAEEHFPSGQWWNPRRCYYIMGNYQGAVVNAVGPVQRSSLSEGVDGLTKIALYRQNSFRDLQKISSPGDRWLRSLSLKN